MYFLEEPSYILLSCVSLVLMTSLERCRNLQRRMFSYATSEFEIVIHSHAYLKPNFFGNLKLSIHENTRARTAGSYKILITNKHMECSFSVLIAEADLN